MKKRLLEILAVALIAGGNVGIAVKEIHASLAYDPAIRLCILLVDAPIMILASILVCKFFMERLQKNLPST